MHSVELTLAKMTFHDVLFLTFTNLKLTLGNSTSCNVIFTKVSSTERTSDYVISSWSISTGYSTSMLTDGSLLKLTRPQLVNFGLFEYPQSTYLPNIQCYPLVTQRITIQDFTEELEQIANTFTEKNAFVTETKDKKK